MSATLFLVWVAVAVRAIMVGLKKSGQLTGNFRRDRRRVLKMLSAAGLATLLPTPSPTPVPKLTQLTHVIIRDVTLKQQMMVESINKVIYFSWNGLFDRDVQ